MHAQHGADRDGGQPQVSYQQGIGVIEKPQPRYAVSADGIPHGGVAGGGPSGEYGRRRMGLASQSSTSAARRLSRHRSNQWAPEGRGPSSSAVGWAEGRQEPAQRVLLFLSMMTRPAVRVAVVRRLATRGRRACEGAKEAARRAPPVGLRNIISHHGRESTSTILHGSSRRRAALSVQFRAHVGASGCCARKAAE
ncbi:hypothetical protein BDV95DRAFT_599891 [Massariosphaeria phaeospora]|uniref:Uncharacterized protein n=1 Tax=Massariosphaeria phaeospora TaxID=100035 RepID=A0A7C8HYM6_9PLEO|nr:hypothetical protein BDV95DRAFT_599891 [Massariosphaeria phaeospora]